MPNKMISGYKEKQFYRNERFTKGVVSTNDPLFEGSFRRLINFKVSNQNASIENREPFLSVPLYDLSNREVKISKDSFVFSLNNDTEHAFILDMVQEVESEDVFEEIVLEEMIVDQSDYFVIDGDTIEAKGVRYRLAFIDAPEMDDYNFKPNDNIYKTLGEEAKAFTMDFLKDGFKIIQFKFQVEKEDKFGRKLAFIVKDINNRIEFLNAELLRNGLANFYNFNNFEKDIVEYGVVKHVVVNRFSINFYSLFDQVCKEGFLLENSCFSKKYTDSRIKIVINSSNRYYTKPVIHKIKKETDLKEVQIEEEGIFKTYLVKRILKTIVINENEVKKDLEVLSDDSFRYTLINKDFSIINGKYKNQYINFFVQIHNQYNAEVYRGLLELSYTPGNIVEGTPETFEFVSYKKPEAHIEIQDLTNAKPNMLDDRSIIPSSYRGIKANVKGYSSPSVNAVLLNVLVNKNLERTNYESDEKVTKYFNSNRAIFEDINNYNLTPFFKAPEIDSERNRYMYRWDFVSTKEIDAGNEEEVKNAKPFYRSAWTEMTDYPNESNNISTNIIRRKKIALNLKNIKLADEYYLISNDMERETITSANLVNLSINDLKDFNTEVDDRKTLEEIQTIFNNFLETKTIDVIKNKIGGLDENGTDKFIDIDGYRFRVTKVKNKIGLLEAIQLNEKEDSFVFEENQGEESKILTRYQRSQIFRSEENENKKIAFIFSGVSVNIEDPKVVLHYASETKGVVFDLRKDGSTVIPYNLNLGALKGMNIPDFDFNDFFKNGIQATFYLYTFKDEESLTEEDEFYDNIAYKKTSATYLFRKGNIYRYSKEDFIDDRLDSESYALRYCNYITQYQDRIVVYGNPNYKNTVFMSEEGAPYYFSLYNAFEFDHEVAHVQTFKTIMLVFTINDIWVIYPWEETNPETFITTISYRVKKVLYNISTEVKNKSTIKNITRYITLMSNNVLYLIKPSTYISDDTEFYLNILSQNVDSIVKEPLTFINERLRYHGIQEEAKEYHLNLNATDNYIKMYYSVDVDQMIKYTLILTYDILNNRWFEEDTCSFGKPHQIYLLDSTTKYEMLTEMNDQLFITYQTDKYKMMMMDVFGQSYYDKNYFYSYPIEYYIDSGYLKINEHLKKRFKTLQINMKNIDSRQILFGYNFTIDDVQFENNFEPIYTTNESDVIVEVTKLKQIELELSRRLTKETDLRILKDLKEQLIFMKDLEIEENKVVISEKKKAVISDIGRLENFFLDFSNLETGDIITVKQQLLGLGRLPRLRMSFSSKNRFYILSFGLIYSEHGGK